MAKLSAAVVSLCVVLTFLAGHGQSRPAADRRYSDKVQNKVRKEVKDAMDYNPGLGAAFIRLVFHDCWINGCDGSVLLDKTPTDGTNTEKKAVNNIGLAGFEFIDIIKKKVGNDASCADILVFAARDAADILSGGKIFYELTGGRKDGVVSSAAAADANLPESTFDFAQLQNNFAGHGFTVDDLVVLSGAHSIGIAHLSSYQDRLRDDASATPIDSNYQSALNKTTPLDLLKQGQNPAVPNNPRDASAKFQKDAAYDPVTLGVSPNSNVLDNSYYHNNLENKVLFKSDWVLRTDDVAAGKLQEYKDNAAKWNYDFAAAMAKLSGLPAQGKNLEIRKKCSSTNKKQYYY